MTTSCGSCFLKLLPSHLSPHHQFSSPNLQPSHHLPIPISISISTCISSHTHYYNNLLPLHASSSTSNPSVIDDQETPIDTLPPGACKGCGKLEMERNCNGEGRIQGGIATVPGFGWWPIKAYRPCPGFVSSGGRYRRQGQSMDEVAGLGREPKATMVKPQSSKKKNGTKKSKS